MTTTPPPKVLDRDRIKLASKASIIEALEMETDELIITACKLAAVREAKALAEHLDQIIAGYVKITQRIHKELRAK